jgi:hypothetical protein
VSCGSCGGAPETGLAGLAVGDVWNFGLDFFIHRTDHGIGASTAAADPGGEARFEVAGRTFLSTGLDEVLYHRTLEDTTIELWIADLYALRPVRERGSSSLDLILGLRNADFDNDYRAIAGVQGVGGTRIDASSNYSRLQGPLVGLALELQRGRHTLRGDLRQSVVFGEVELSRTLRDFTGPAEPFAGPPEGVPEGLTQDLGHRTSTWSSELGNA